MARAIHALLALARRRVYRHFRSARALAARIRARCRRRARGAAAVAAGAGIALIIGGCQQLPSRSQTMTIRECRITVYAGAAGTNAPGAEIASQAMAIETAGAETHSASLPVTATADVDLPRAGGAGGALGEAAAALIRAAAPGERPACNGDAERPQAPCAACGEGE